jgi:cell division protease FtsH
MVMRYGMEEKLGHVAYEAERPQFLGIPDSMQRGRDFSEETAREIDRAVRDRVNQAFDKATAILTRNRAVLEQGAQLLLEKETLIEDDLARLHPQQVAVQDRGTAEAASRS